MITGDTGTTIPCSIRRCPLDRTFSLFLIHSLFYGHPGVSWDTLLKVDHLRGCRASILVFHIYPAFLDKLFPGSTSFSMNWLVCGHRVVSQGFLLRPQELGPGESWFTEPSDISVTETSRKECLRIKIHLVSAPWGKASQGEPGFDNKVSQAVWSLLSWYEKPGFFFHGEEHRLGSWTAWVCNPLLLLSAVWSQANYSTSLSLSSCINK